MPFILRLNAEKTSALQDPENNILGKKNSKFKGYKAEKSLLCEGNRRTLYAKVYLARDKVLRNNVVGRQGLKYIGP